MSEHTQVRVSSQVTGLDVRLLGPVELWRDGQTMQVSGPRQRALLAVLALQANEVVSSDRLIEALFGPEASPAAANAIQAAVSRLRRVLPDDVLETRQPGYVIHLSPDELDTARFEITAREGRSLLDAGDAIGAAATLRQALAIWRGDALTNVDGHSFAQLEIRRLEELRLVAVMDCADADLALGRSADLVPELERLSAAHPLQERLHGQLILALYRCGRQADALAAYRELRDRLNEELGLEPSRALRDLERAMLLHDPGLDQAAPAAAKAPAERGVASCPFKGLASFGAADADYFFGRERVVDELVARLAGATFVGVVGASGSGKSSLLQAGLLAALERGTLPGSASWEQILMRPGRHPRLELPDVQDGQRLVIAVDQLEELFTACDVEVERARFLSRLAECAIDVERRYVVLVAMRADFYARCAPYPDFAAELSRSHVLLGAMKRDELYRAIEQPAKRAGLSVDRDLIDTLVDDVAGEPGSLPLLSTTLVELWRERDGRHLGLQAYRQSGGVRGAVARLAESAYAQLDHPEQVALRLIMLRLVRESDGVVTRRRVPLPELDLDDDSAAARAVSTFTDARLLTATDGALEISHEALLGEWPRLVAWLDEDRLARQAREHLAESARQWAGSGRHVGDLYRGPRLVTAVELIDADRVAPNALERAFVEASRDEHERESLLQRQRVRRLRFLLAGVVALLVLAVAAGTFAVVQRRTARRQATASLAGQLGAEAVAEPRVDLAMLLAREAVALDRTDDTEGTLLATLLRSPAAVATYTTPLLSRPLRISVSPDGRTLAVGDNQATVRMYDTRSHRIRAVLNNAGFGGLPPVYFSNGSRFVVSRDGPVPSVEIFDARTLKVVKRLLWDKRWLTRQPQIGGWDNFAVSPDGRIVYYAYDVLGSNGNDGPAYLDVWNTKTGARITRPLGLTGALDLRVVDGGRRLEILGDDRLETVDAQTLRRLRVESAPSESQEVAGADAITPDGRTLAVGNASGGIVFVDLATGRRRTAQGSQPSAVQGAAFSPDGRTLVTTGEDGSVIVWDAATGEPVAHLTGHAGRTTGVAFSPHSRTLFTSSLDGTILEWDLGTSRRFGQPFEFPVRPPALAGGTVTDEVPAPPLAVSPDGRELAARTGPTKVGLFDVRTLGKVGSVDVARSVGLITAFAWSRSGTLAVVGSDGTVQIWKVRGRPRLTRRLRGLGSINGQHETVESVAFSRDGRFVAAGDVNHTPGTTPYRFGTVAVWNTATGRLLWKARTKRGAVYGVPFSPDGHTIAAAHEDGSVVLYDAATGRVDRTLELEGGGDFSFETDAFAPDGTLLTGTWAGVVQHWDPADGRELGSPRLVAAAPVASISFDPTGDRFATTGGSDGLARVWTTSTLQQFGATFPGYPGQWGTAAFTPGGSKLVVLYRDGRGFVWPASLGAWERHACQVAGRNLTREEWSRFVSGRAYRPTCG